MSGRLDQEREKKLQPQRMEFARKQIEGYGYEITYQDETRIEFYFKGHKVLFYPYSGWFTGKTIRDGRGIEKLLKQL